MNLVHKCCHNSHQLYHIVAKIKEFMERDWRVHISHTYREGNLTANWMISSAIDDIVGVRILENPLLDTFLSLWMIRLEFQFLG